MKPEVIATADDGSLLWGVRVDKENGLMVGVGPRPEDIEELTPLVLFFKWDSDWNIKPEWLKRFNEEPNPYTTPYWNKVKASLDKENA